MCRSMSLNKSEASWEGTNLDKQKWVDFINSDIWKAFLFELEDREKYLIQLFKDSDKEWSPDVIKGKLTEIDYFKHLPALLVLSIKDRENKPKEDDDGN